MLDRQSHIKDHIAGGDELTRSLLTTPLSIAAQVGLRRLGRSKEPGKSYGTALTLDQSARITQTVDREDADFYRVVLNGGGTVNLTFQDLAAQNAIASAFVNRRGKALARYDRRPFVDQPKLTIDFTEQQNSYRLQIKDVPRGVYYLTVETRQTASQRYRFRLNITETDNGPPVVPPCGCNP